MDIVRHNDKSEFIMDIENRTYYCRVCGEGYNNSVAALACEGSSSIKQPFLVGESIYIFPRYDPGVIEKVISIEPFRHGWLVHLANSYLMSKEGPPVDDFYFCNDKDVQDCKLKSI